MIEKFPNLIAPVLGLRDGQILPGGAVRVVDRHSSFYPVPAGDDSWILIDAGMDKRAANLQKFMTERNLAKSAFLAGFITHAHSDHVGGFNIFDNLPIYVGQGDEQVILGNRRSQGPLQGLIDRIPGHRDAKIDGLQPRIISNDQVIEIGNLTIRAIGLAGHTDGSMGYLVGHNDSGEYVFYAGDAFGHRRSGKVKAPPRIVSHNKRASHRSTQYAATRIIDLGIEPRAIVTSHSRHGDFAALKRYSHVESSRLMPKVS